MELSHKKIDFSNQHVEKINYDDEQDIGEYVEIINLNTNSFALSNENMKSIIFTNCNINNIEIEKTKLQHIQFVNSNVKHLCIGNNELENLNSLPNNIITLDAHNNNIKKVNQLPDTIKYLDLSENLIEEITCVPYDIVKFEIFDNKLTQLDVNLLKRPTLKHLDVTENKFSDKQIHEIAQLDIKICYVIVEEESSGFSSSDEIEKYIQTYSEKKDKPVIIISDSESDSDKENKKESRKQEMKQIKYSDKIPVRLYWNIVL